MSAWELKGISGYVYEYFSINWEKEGLLLRWFA